MAKKIVSIILIHECDEDPCHLNNENQSKWIKENLPLNKLEWNWKLFALKVYDIRGVEHEESVDAAIENMKEGKNPKATDS